MTLDGSPSDLELALRTGRHRPHQTHTRAGTASRAPGRCRPDVERIGRLQPSGDRTLLALGSSSLDDPITGPSGRRHLPVQLLGPTCVESKVSVSWEFPLRPTQQRPPQEGTTGVRHACPSRWSSTRQTQAPGTRVTPQHDEQPVPWTPRSLRARPGVRLSGRESEPPPPPCSSVWRRRPPHRAPPPSSARTAMSGHPRGHQGCSSTLRDAQGPVPGPWPHVSSASKTSQVTNVGLAGAEPHGCPRGRCLRWAQSVACVQGGTL